MARDRRDTLTADLLDWVPTDPTVRFEDERVRGATLNARYCRAMAAALEECGETRETVAERMGAYLGAPVSKAMLDAYVSEARETHIINVVRFHALVHATRDMRLASILPSEFGCSVVDSRDVALVRAARMRERAAELDRMAEVEERRARGMTR